MHFLKVHSHEGGLVILIKSDKFVFGREGIVKSDQSLKQKNLQGEAKKVDFLISTKITL
jgi:hypothetical protein